MSRIENQMQLPEDFHEWSAEFQVSHLMSMRSRVLMWHKHDVFMGRFKHCLNLVDSMWWFFAIATLLGASIGANEQWFMGIWEVMFDYAFDLCFLLLGWKLSDLWWRMRLNQENDHDSIRTREGEGETP